MTQTVMDLVGHVVGITGTHALIGAAALLALGVVGAVVLLGKRKGSAAVPSGATERRQVEHVGLKPQSEPMHAPSPKRPAVISVADVVGEMTDKVANRTAMLNRRSSEVISLTEAQMRTLDDPYAEESGGAKVDAALHTAFKAGDLLELPTCFDTQEFTLREKFCGELSNAEHTEQLLEALRGKQAFRAFSQVVGRLGIHEQWEHYRDRAFEVIAVQWLEKHGIAYERDQAKAA